MTTPPRRPSLIERRMAKFSMDPPSVRAAAGFIVSATTVIVIGAGALIRVLDPHEYPSIFVGMWWALQTVTTVGYGDVTPKNVAGRLVGTAVMLEGIAFLAIITAAITSTFVARAERERLDVDAARLATEEKAVQARLDALDDRLAGIEEILRELRAGR